MAAAESPKSITTQGLDALVSPRDIADAIGASESSLRRWIDNGDIRVSRTAGGHRRVTLREAVQFIRRIGALVIHPEKLNLPSVVEAPRSRRNGPAGDEEQLFDALCKGEREIAQGLAISWYLRGRALHELFDGPVRGALHRVVALWKHEERGILIEHRATDICLGLMTGLQSLMPSAPESAPLAIGAAPPDDPYQIPSRMAGIVLAEAGLREMNFGANTPLELLAKEAVLTCAKLVWLSISVVLDAKSLRTGLKILATALADRNAALVIGGHASAGCAPRGAANVHVIGSMGELAAFGQGLLGRSASG